MKNLLRSTLYLLVFACAGILFQISCSTDSLSTSTTVGKMLYLKKPSTSAALQIWTCDYNGANQTQIPISLPTDVQINGNNGKATPRLSPDGQKVFFVTVNYVKSEYSIYSCNIDGTNLQLITSQANTDTLEIGGVY